MRSAVAALLVQEQPMNNPYIDDEMPAEIDFSQAKPGGRLYAGLD
ncbi:MAG: hypothetical protein NTV70_00275 [Acidobacteria bacterium]|nr:hypothetical protein [Acidobacteriota bacterium]